MKRAEELVGEEWAEWCRLTPVQCWLESAFKTPKPKCPFVPQREMVRKLWGTEDDPLAHKDESEQRLAKVRKQSLFRD